MSIKNTKLDKETQFVIGKTALEWLRSLLTSFSSVFHQDSRGILEIS